MGYDLSKRLQACLDAIAPYETVADIGTDHAYLPCFGILNGVLTSAIAADIGVGPLQAAKQQVSRYDLEHKVETRLGGGLSVLKQGEVETIVIAGMGGKLILSILDDDKDLTSSFKRIICQPNIDANLLRMWLSEHYFKITDEKIILEDGKYYEVIVAEPSDEKIPLSNLDIEFGARLRLEKNEIFISKWEKEFKKNNEIIKQLPKTHERRHDLEKRQALLKEVL